jgi:predicted ester cyclase
MHVQGTLARSLCGMDNKRRAIRKIMAIQDLETFIRSLYDGFNNHITDPHWLDKVVVDVSDDCNILDIPSGMALVGKEGMQLFLTTWTTAFPDCSIDVTNMLIGEEQAFVEFTCRGTHTGTLYGPGGEITPSGRKLVLHYCSIYRFKDGELIEQRIYYDALSLLQQIGLINEEI